MTLRLLAFAGWICFGLDALFIVYLLIVRNAGNDAAGRGVATGFGLVLLPLLLLAGGVLLWGTRTGAKSGVVGGTLLVALPFIYLAWQQVNTLAESARYAATKARDGRFQNATLQRIVALIDAKDTTGLRTLLATHPPLPLAETDAAGHTLFGFAVARATDMFATPDKVTSLGILLQAGVPYAADALEPGGDWTRDLVTSGSDVHNDLIALALDAGANANAREGNGNQAMILSYNQTPAKLALLVQHGADVQALTKDGANALMHAVRFKLWKNALFFLEHGVSADYVAPDGSTVDTVLEKVEADAQSYQEALGPDHDAFVAALRRHRHAAK